MNEHCLFCGNTVPQGKANKNVHRVKTPGFRESICDTIVQRNDDRGSEVNRRIEIEVELVGAGAVYHGQCHVNFLTFRNIPNAQSNVVGTVKKGAPVNKQLHDSFLQLVEFLEVSDVPYSTSELSAKMEQYSGGET